MKKILSILSLVMATNLMAHSHGDMKFTESSFFNSEKAIVNSVELGKTDDGDMGVKFLDFGISTEVNNKGNIYFTNDHLVILNKNEDKLTAQMIVPFFDEAPYDEKLEKGVHFHSYKDALHMHLTVEKEDKVVEINDIDYDVIITESKTGKTIYAEKNGKFVFTTWVDRKNQLPTLGLLVATNGFIKGEKIVERAIHHHHDGEEHMEEHHHDHNHEGHDHHHHH